MLTKLFTVASLITHRHFWSRFSVVNIQSLIKMVKRKSKISQGPHFEFEASYHSVFRVLNPESDYLAKKIYIKNI